MTGDITFAASQPLPANLVTGTLGVSNGGTGATTLTGVLKGNGTSAFTAGSVSLSSEVSGTLPVGSGGTGLNTIGASLQVLRVNAGGTALEYGTLAGFSAAQAYFFSGF